MNPMLKKWELYFERAYGPNNRFTVAKAFAEFWKNSSADKIEIPGKCMLGGRVFGKEDCEDNTEIFTPDIISVERIERGEGEEFPHDLMCATSISSSNYYFYSDEYNAYMFMLLDDIIHTGRLQPSYCYLKGQYQNSNLI